MITFIADLHLRVPTEKIEEEWYIKRWHNMLEKLQKNEYLVIGGDFFDAPPSFSSLLLALETFIILSKKYEKIYIIEGNHDYKGKHHYLLEFLKIIHQIFNNIHWTASFHQFKIKNYQTIICNHSYLKDYIPLNCDLFIGHIRGKIAYAQEEYNISQLKEKCNLILLGDLHNEFDYDFNIFYSGSPYRINSKKIQLLNEIDNNFYGYLMIDKWLQVNKVELNLPNKYKILVNADNYDELKKELGYFTLPTKIIYQDNLLLLQPDILKEEEIIENTYEVPNFNIDIFESVHNYLKEKLNIKDTEKFIKYLRKII